MRLLLDENAPIRWVNLLNQLGHQTEHVIDRGLRGASDHDVLAYAIDEDLTLLTLNKFTKGPDRRATIMNDVRVRYESDAEIRTKLSGRAEESE